MKSTQIIGSDSSKGGYMNGLDGLRALSVLVVIVYHLNVSGLQEGFWGLAFSLHCPVTLLVTSYLYSGRTLDTSI